MNRVISYQRSDQIQELAGALILAQGEIQGAKKDSENPHLKSRYADLASVWEACRIPLTKNGLCVLQPVSASTDGVVTVTTLLTHKSGQWISSDLPIKAQQNTPQGIGSAITYGRRYGLSAMVGIAPEDDDGEAAEGRPRGSKKAAEEMARRRIDEEAGKLASVAKAREEQQPLPLDKKPEASVKSKNFQMLEAFGEMKKAIGEPEYYKILGAHGYEKSNQITDAKVAREIYKEMGKVKADQESERLKKKHGPDDFDRMVSEIVETVETK